MTADFTLLAAETVYRTWGFGNRIERGNQNISLEMIARIGEDPMRPYYEAWLAALEDVLSGVVDEAAVRVRATALREVDDHEDDHP